jgi:hypothetical protein
MTNQLRIGLLVALLLDAFPAAGLCQQPTKPDAASIISRMKEALDPTLPSVRIMTLKVNATSSTPIQFRLGQARGEANGSKWMLTVVLLPHAWGEGIALLDEDRPPETALEYVYLPAVQRIRRFSPLEAWEPFFGSDFSYQDFSFPRSSSRVKFEDVEDHNGTSCYKLEEPLSSIPYYSKVDTWLASATSLPIEREYYDLQGKPYKSEQYERTLTIQNIPTITRVVMRNLQQSTSSEIEITSVKYDKEAPRMLFDPKKSG